MATKLHEWRREHGLTLQEMHDLTGVSSGMVSRLERGQRRASPALKVTMARRLGVRVAPAPVSH